MKILQLCKKFPFPLRDGESKAIYALAKNLHQHGVTLHLLAMNTSKHWVDINDDVRSALSHYERLEWTRVDNDINPMAAIKNLFSNESYHVSRFISKEFADRLKRILQAEQYDIIQLESLYLAPYIEVIKEVSNAKIVLRAHNVEHEIWQRMASSHRNLFSRWYLDIMSKRLELYEQSVLSKIDMMLPISTKDEDYFKVMGYSGRSKVIPVGLIDVAQYQFDPTVFQPVKDIAFIGSLDWMPNVEGLTWFLNNIWPDLYAKYPHLRCHIAGRNTPEKLMQMSVPGVTFYGEVPCANEFLADKAIVVVPLFAGSGMRVKILEAMSLGKAVVTTSIGLEGIDATHEKEVIIADDGQSFRNEIEALVTESNKAEIMAWSGQQWIQENFDQNTISKGLLNSYKSLLRHHKRNFISRFGP